jgi:transposase InsO family protein
LADALLESILQQFPFAILNFHSGNGSEFINKTVAQLLEKLRVEQTKSRPRKSGDNGLVETKNGAIVRKHIGWGHIGPAHAAPLNQFYTGFLNPCVNYHRPSAQAEVHIGDKGRKRRLYKQWKTPFEKLLSLDRPQLSATPMPHAACNRQKTTSSSR